LPEKRKSNLLILNSNILSNLLSSAPLIIDFGGI